MSFNFCGLIPVRLRADQNSNLNFNDLKFPLNFEKFNNSCCNLGYLALILINYFSHEFRSRKFCFPSTERNFFLCLEKKI